MRVIQVAQEPTRMWVESSSLSCQNCEKIFSRLQTKYAKLVPGDECPKCGGKLKTRFHLVDIATNPPIGTCTCEHFAFRLGPESMTLSRWDRQRLTQRQLSDLRCVHLDAARQVALDITIRSHEAARGNGMAKEEAAP